MKILNDQMLQKHLKMKDVIDITEKVYLQKSHHESVTWDTIFYDFEPGKADMDIKSGFLKTEKIFGHKTVTWFGDNAQKGLPTLAGLICVFDATTGRPYGITDAVHITGMRTGAAGAIGAKYLANPKSTSALIVGTGNQLKYQVSALLTVFPKLEIIHIYNRNFDKARAAVTELPSHLKNLGGYSEEVMFEPVKHLENSVENSDIIITITSSKEAIIKKEWLSPGTHLSCIGADMAGKQEIDAEIFKDAQIYTDDLVHSSKVGEMEMAIKKGWMTKDDVTGEIGDLISHKIEGRKSHAAITVFDATGMALMDIATAKIAIDHIETDEENEVNF